MLWENTVPVKAQEEKVRVNRILMIDEAIRFGTYPSIAKLAEKAEVNGRSIERDIEYLRDIYQSPVEYDRQKRGYYYTEPNFFIKSIMLTEGELFSIALFDRLLEQYRNTPPPPRSCPAADFQQDCPVHAGKYYGRHRRIKPPGQHHPGTPGAN